MNITLRVRGTEIRPGDPRRIAEIEATIAPATTGPQFAPHVICVSTDGALCEVKGAVMDQVRELIRHELGLAELVPAPRRVMVEAGADCGDSPIGARTTRRD